MALLAAPSRASAHIVYSCGTQYNPYGVCATFRGYTTNDSGSIVDPINFAWYPRGGTPNATYAEGRMGWNDTCGSGQYNYRIYTGGTWQNVAQNSQRGQSWCPNSRYHGRNFDGHHANGTNDQWSAVDMHHESWPYHNIDMSWNSARNYAAALAFSVGYYDRQDQFTFLPLGQGNFQGYYADGWVTRVGA